MFLIALRPLAVIAFWTLTQADKSIDWKLLKCGCEAIWRKPAGWITGLIRKFYIWFNKIGRYWTLSVMQ